MIVNFLLLRVGVGNTKVNLHCDRPRFAVLLAGVLSADLSVANRFSCWEQKPGITLQGFLAHSASVGMNHGQVKLSW